MVVAPGDGEEDVAALAEHGELFEAGSLDERDRFPRVPALLAVLPHREAAGERDGKEVESSSRACECP